MTAAAAKLLPSVCVLGCLLSQCASGPGLTREVEVGTDDRVVVVFEQPRQSFSQSLLSRAVVDPSEFYSSQSSDPYAKVLSQDGAQLLLDHLATAGFFRHARPAPAPGAISNIHVRVNDSNHTWSSHAGMTAEEALGFNDCLVAFQDIYNRTESFHVSRGGEQVLEEHRKLDRRRQEYFHRDKGRR